MTAPVRGDEVRLDPPGPPPTGLGRFGEFGGRFVPETLIPALEELEAEFRTAWTSRRVPRGVRRRSSPATPAGPTPVTECHRLSERLGVRVLLKREDLTHTGSHKINNVLGQALLTRRMGKQRVIAETGAGQHGVATATAAALFGLDCIVFMGAVDVERQALNVFRMELLGAEVIPVTSGSATLKDAINDALRDWVATVETTHYCIGSVVGPHPYPWIVREFQRVVGDEAREQCRAILDGTDPDYVRRVRRWRVERDRDVRRLPRHRRRAHRRRGGRARARVGQARRVREPGRPGRAARRPLAVPPGRGRPDPRGSLDQRRPRLPGRRARARGARGAGPGHVRLGDRRGGARRVPAAEPDRGDRARRSSRRTRSAGWPERSGPPSRRARRCWSRCPGAATRTRCRSPSGSPGSRSSEARVDAPGEARRGQEAARPVRHRRARRRLARRRARGRRGRRRRDRDRHPVLGPGDGRPDDPGGVAARARHRRDAGGHRGGPRQARRRRPARRDDVLQPGAAHGPRAVRGRARRAAASTPRSCPTSRSTSSTGGATAADAAGIETVLLAGPTTGDERLARDLRAHPRVRLRRRADGCDR